MKKIVNHPQLTLDLLLNKFKINNSVKFFIIILKFAVKKRISLNQKLIEAWSCVDRNTATEEDLNMFSDILKDIIIISVVNVDIPVERVEVAGDTRDKLIEQFDSWS